MLQFTNLTQKKKILFLCVFGLMITFASCVDDKSKSDEDKVKLEKPEMKDEGDAYKSQDNTKAKKIKEDAIKAKKKANDMSGASMPTFTYIGCEDADDSRQCTINKIQEYVKENFDVESVEEEVNRGEHTVHVNFIIDNKGRVNQVEARSKSSLLADEAKRIISSLPKMKPAMKDGKAVEATYALPVKFKIN